METRSLVSGAAVAALAVAVSLLLRVLFGLTYLPEIAASAVFSLVPGSIESSAVENLGPLAKEATYFIASLVLVLVLAAVPPVLKRLGILSRRGPSAALEVALSSYFLLLSLSAFFLAITRVPALPVSPGSVALGMLVPVVVFAAASGLFSFYPARPAQSPYPAERVKRPYDRKRRLFIASAAGAAVGAAILYYGVGALISKQTPVPAGQETNLVLSSQVTANSDFYRVDINVFAPSVDSSTWKLNVHGLVNTPMTLDYASIMSLSSVEEYATLECVSNVVGGDLVSTALWKGVQLKTVLETAGVNPQADYLVFRCSDGYDVGIPLERAMANGTILAYEMNGEPLPTDHGYPLRAIVPGLYGMMNPKWITDIELVSGAYEGYWQRTGWTNIATYQTGSTTISPGNSPLRDRFPIPSTLEDVFGPVVPLIGVAFAGDRGISRVEVSTDGGATWQDASLYDPLSEYTWVFWRLDWNPAGPGGYRIAVRATDKSGVVQVASLTNPFPNGTTGYSVIDIGIAPTQGSGT